MTKKTQYELEREANIARNRAIMEELELKQAVESLGLPKKSSPAPQHKAKPIQPKRKREQEEFVPQPRRKSSRINGGADPKESPISKRKRERDAQLQREEEQAEYAKAKKARHYDLDLRTLADNHNKEEITALSNELKSLPGIIRRVGSMGEHENRQDERAVEELQEKFKDVKIVSRAKVTQNRVYSALYHPDVTKDLVFFGDKHGQLGIWDAQATPDATDEEVEGAEDREGGKYWQLQPHWPATAQSSISCIRIDPLNSNKIYTSAYDCTIRALDFTTEKSQEIFSREDDRQLISHIDLPPTGNEMWFSDTQGGVYHIDLRQSKSKFQKYELSDKKIGCVSINPTRPDFLLTASNSRSMRIWDVRRLQSMYSSLSDAPPTPPASSPEPSQGFDEFSLDAVMEFNETAKGKGTLRGEWQHGKSVTSAYWDARGRGIVSTCYDDVLRLWDYRPNVFDTSGPFPTSKPFWSQRHNCQTGAWLTLLRAQWSPNPDVYPHFTIANMDHSVNIFSGRGDIVARFADNTKITAVQAVTCSHPSIVERVATGNGTGRCVLWAPGASVGNNE